MKKNKGSCKVVGRVIRKEELAEIDKMRLAFEALKDIPSTTGTYPMATINKTGVRKERTPWQDGWNACLMDYSKRLRKIVDRCYGKHTNNLLFLYYTGAGWIMKDKFCLCMNDTFAWGCADGEDVPFSKLQEVVDLYHRYGDSGLTYWVAEQRGYDPHPEMKYHLDAVRYVRKLNGRLK